MNVESINEPLWFEYYLFPVNLFVCTLPNQIFKTVIGVGLLPNLALLHLSEWFMAHEFWFKIFVVSISYGMVSTFSTEIPFQFSKTNFFSWYTSCYPYLTNSTYFNSLLYKNEIENGNKNSIYEFNQIRILVQIFPFSL